MIDEMKDTCRNSGAKKGDNSVSAFDSQKGSTLLEVFALEI
jgi:hypothetical protein